MIIVIAFILMAAALDPDTAQTQSALTNVPYAAVLSLDARDPDERLQYGPDPLQYALRWSGSTSMKAKASLLFLHGGCWSNAFDLHHAAPLVVALAQQGFETWSIEYRRSGDSGGGWPGTYEDVLSAVDQILARSGSAQSILLGHSAGGHLSVLAATQLGQRITGVIGLAAITDITRYAQGSAGCQRAARKFMGGRPTQKPTEYAAASLTNKTIHPRTFLLQGDADTLVPVSQSQLSRASTIIEPGAGHFDWIHPDSQAFQTLLTTLDTIINPHK